MEYLVTTTTRVPDGTSPAALRVMRTRGAARSRERAAQGHLLTAERRAILASLPVDGGLEILTTPISTQPSDQAAATPGPGAGHER